MLDCTESYDDPNAADYEFDVFFSYKRHDQTLVWTRELLSRFRFYLSHELNVLEARVFLDEEGIELGAHWPERIQQALRRSKCMVCVLSPMYFQSEWCYSEWQSFRERERLLAENEQTRLIAPLKFHDGQHFPADARELQWVDVSPYNNILPAFWDTAKAVELVELLKSFAGSVADMVRGAPAYRDWPIIPTAGQVRPRIELAKL